MRKARSLGHQEGEHLGRVNWDDILSPLISPFCRMGQRNKAGPPGLESKRVVWNVLYSASSPSISLCLLFPLSLV